MAEHTKISPPGEEIIPREICQRLNWQPGIELEFDPFGGELVVRQKQQERERISIEEFVGRVPPHDGPPVTIEEMNEAIEPARAERWAAKEARSR